jgi:hypothetical protein
MRQLLIGILIISQPHVCLSQLRSPDIQVTKTGDFTYTLTISTFDTTDVSAAQDLLVPSVKSLCVNSAGQFGHFQYETQKALTPGGVSSIKLVQEVRCTNNANSAAKTLVQQERAVDQTTADDQAVRLAFEQYFIRKDAGEYMAAYEQFSPGAKAAVSYEGWLKNSKEFYKMAGKLLDRKITQISWSQDPPDVEAGLYAAVDFSGHLQNADIYCGYIVFSRQRGPSFHILREEENYVERSTSKTMSAEQILQLRHEYGCVDQ